jgi:hypothetical protein
MVGRGRRLGEINRIRPIRREDHPEHATRIPVEPQIA